MRKPVEHKNITRRKFLALGSMAGAAACSLSWGETNSSDQAIKQLAPESDKSTVAVLRSPKVWIGDKDDLDFSVLRQMLDRSLCLSFNEDNPVKAWSRIVSPSDVVGIKLNCLGGRSICTHHELVHTVVQSLLDAGVPPGNIIVWDRSDNDLTNAKYELQKTEGQIRKMGSPSLDSKKYSVAGIETQISSLVTETCSVLINVPVLKTHAVAGLSGALKNNMGAISNPVKFHPENCKSVGDLNTLEPLRRKTKLIIVDALRPLYDKGPGDYPKFRWKYNGLIVGSDPVAVDKTGFDIISEKRNQVRGEVWPVNPYPAYIARAAELGIGQSDLSQINILSDEV